MRILADSPATPALPTSILLSPVVRAPPAPIPNPMLLLPLVLLKSALTPVAVLLPHQLREIDLAPSAPRSNESWRIRKVGLAPFPLSQGDQSDPATSAGHLPHQPRPRPQGHPAFWP